ncbi:MAG: serine hydrolase domain-containing protein [Bacteroidota bacterium]
MKNLLLSCLVLFGVSLISAQTPSQQKSTPLTSAAPQTVGISPERLARIDAMCEKAIADGEVPGIVALIARKGKIVYHKAFGQADNTSNRELKKDDIFRIASQTKAITSTAVMMLWEEGHFRLDDPISKWIPEFKNPKVLSSHIFSDGTYMTKPANKEITIRHLLTHTSGIGYGMIDGDERMRQIYKEAGIVDAFATGSETIGENIKKLAALPLHHHPGEAFTYSEGLDVLGYFIEIISGMPFDQFLKTRLFEPLGMNDTYFYLPRGKAARLVTVQMPKDGAWVKYPGREDYYDADYPIKGSKTFFSGGAGLSSTAEDYATFLQMYLNGGELNGIRILSRTTVQSIMGNHVKDFWGGADGAKHYGLAFGVVRPAGQDQGGEGSIGTFDWGGYFNTQYFADPKEEIIGILMKQTRYQSKDQTAWKFRLMTGAAIDD